MSPYPAFGTYDRRALHQQGLAEGRQPDGSAHYVPLPAVTELEPRLLTGLRADILQNPHGQFSNEGFSSYCTEVTLIGAGVDGRPITGPSEPTEQAPAVCLRTRGGGVSLVAADPATGLPAGAPDGEVGPMMGGTYVASPDSRFKAAVGFYGAVALHDRYETVEQYASYD